MGLLITCPIKYVRFRPRVLLWQSADRVLLKAGLDKLSQEIAGLRNDLKSRQDLLELLPDVEIYESRCPHCASNTTSSSTSGKSRWPRAYSNRVWKGPDNCARAKHHGTQHWVWSFADTSQNSTDQSSRTGWSCLSHIRVNTSASISARCLVPRSRRETLSEVNFIRDRQSSTGEFTPPNAFVLHPYGRYCNANKFAGEIDLFEALDHIKKHYPIDDDRLVMRGFSMGGAACWQFAVHYPGMWAAAAPGAGFSETPDFLKVFQNEVDSTDMVRKETVASL